MKKTVFILVCLAGLLAAQTMNNFCSAPPFVGGKIRSSSPTSC